MSNPNKLDESLREAIIARADQVLADEDVIRALLSAQEDTRAENVIDFRGIAMQQLEQRLSQLTSTHRGVVAAAYENVAGTAQIHRAILRMLDAADFREFLRDLGGEVLHILQVDSLGLALELTSKEPNDFSTISHFHIVPKGFVNDYLGDQGKAAGKQVVLRQLNQADRRIHGKNFRRIRSEACLRLSLGTKRSCGLLILGHEDPQKFAPQQGVDLLSLLAGVCDRRLRHWLT